MKRLLFVFTLLFITVTSFSQTTKHNYPKTGKPIITIQVPSNWTVTNETNYLSFAPDDKSDYGRMISMIWKSENPGAEDAVTVLVEESFDLVETLLTDLEWDEETSDFTINGIDFVAIDGWGNYSNEDGSKEEMMATVMIFFPDDTNLVTFVYMGLEKAYTKYKDEFLGIIQSIKPY